MSANNHDSGDPNNVRYAKQKLSPHEENMGRLIKIYSMTQTHSFSKWLEWMNENYKITKL